MKELEICISADAIPLMCNNIAAALAAGARRIELCADMASEGLTPSLEAIAAASSVMTAASELLVMIRPHNRSFCYSQDEVKQMLAAIDGAAALGVQGLVLGALTPGGQLDTQAMGLLLARAKHHQLKVTFHRAFDLMSGASGLMSGTSGLVQKLAQLGIGRLLTSGSGWQQPLPALAQRLERLEALAQAIAGRFELVIGGGVDGANAQHFWPLAESSPTPISLHSFSGVLAPGGHIMPAKIKALLAH